MKNKFRELYTSCIKKKKMKNIELKLDFFNSS